VIYTNNDQIHGSDITQLGAATLSQRGDTLVAEWQVTPTVEVRQVAFPVYYQSSGQIVVEFNLTNNTAQPLTAGAQYLLHTWPIGNTGAPFCTEQGGLRRWGRVNVSSFRYKPFYSLPTVNDPKSFNRFTAGILSDSALHILLPDSITFGDWTTMSQWHYGSPESLPNEQVMDDALLLRWAPVLIPSGATALLGSTSYGVTDPSLCKDSNWVTVTFGDRTFPSVDSFTSTRSTLETFAWNVSAANSYNYATARLKPNAPIRLLEITDSAGGSTVSLTPPQLGPGSYGFAAWRILAPPSLTDAQIYSSLNLSISSNPARIEVCPIPITIEPLHSKDVVPPTVTEVRSGSYDHSDCNTRIYRVHVLDTGKGLQAITVLDHQNVSVETSAFSVGDTSAEFMVSVDDSLLDGRATIEVSDAAGNTAEHQYNYCTIRDTLKPEVSIDHVIPDVLDVVFTDDRPWDRGLSSQKIVSSCANCTFQLISMDSIGASSLHYRASRADTSLPSLLCLVVHDLIGNGPVDTCITFGPTAGVSLATTHSITVAPNPAQDDVRIRTSGASNYSVEVLDLLGHSVIEQRSSSENTDLDISRLPNGVYILRILEGTAIESRRLVVRR
jgi:hypothetical protein